MEDPVLNRCLEECRELRTRWTQFNDFIKMAVSGRQVTPQAEMKFIELKSRIAMLHDGLMERLEHDQKTGMNMMDIMRDHLLLRRVAQYNEAETQKFNFDWNECFLLLTDHIGTLEQEQTRLASISEAAYKAGRRKEILSAKFYNFVHSFFFKIAVGSLVVLFLVIGVPVLGIYDYTELRHQGWAKVPYTLFTNYFYRPYVDPEVPYAGMDNIPKNNAYQPVKQIRQEPFDDVEDGPRRSSPVYFEQQVLPEIMQLEGEALNKARTVFANRVSFGAERFDIQGAEDVVFYYIFWWDTKTAKSFVDAVINAEGGGQARPDEVFMMRRANFVGIALGKHAHRQAYFEERWRFQNVSNLL